MSDKALDELAEHITLKQGDAIVGTDIAFGELTVEISIASARDFIEFLKTDRTCGFSTLVDITAVDQATRETVAYTHLTLPSIASVSRPGRSFSCLDV